MRVLITGGAGYVGSAVAAHFVASGFDVVAFDSLDFGGESLSALNGQPAFRLVSGDIRDATSLAAAMRGCDAVINLAAIVGEPACNANPSAAETINRDAAISAIGLAERQGVDRFLCISTCSNYGVLDANQIADEDGPLTPLSLYARTKVDVERFALAQSGRMTTTVLRLGTICGLSARMRFDLLVNELARSAATERQIELYKTSAWRPFLHVRDAARAFAHVLGAQRSEVARRVFNVVGANYQKSGLAELTRKHFPNAKIIVTDSHPDNRDYRVSGARIERELGFTCSNTIEDAFVGVARAVADGVFLDPFWPGYCATPSRGQATTVAV